MDKILIRASSAYKIMTDARGGFTEANNVELNELIEKSTKKPLTEKQTQRLQELEVKKKSGKKLSETAISYAFELYNKNKFNREVDITNFSLEKGKDVENTSIDNYNEVFGTFYVKSEKEAKDDYTIGHIDIDDDTISTILDMKNCTTLSTFQDKFKNEIIGKKNNIDNTYYWQGIVYMELFNRENYKLVYALTSISEEMLIKQIMTTIYNDIKFYPATRVINGNYFDIAENIVSAINSGIIDSNEILHGIGDLVLGDNEYSLSLIDKCKKTYLNNYFDNKSFGYIPIENRFYIQEFKRNKQEYAALKNEIDIFMSFYNKIDKIGLPVNGKICNI